MAGLKMEEYIDLEYIDYDEALKIYHKTVEKSGGGMAGVRDEGGIRTVLENVRNDLYYPEIWDKAGYLMFSLCRGHYFADCNKRISLTITANFLLINGYVCIAEEFLKEMRDIALDLAAGCMDKNLLTELLRCMIMNEERSESVRLELLNVRQARIELEKQYSEK